jgi:hypothetical protein
MRVSEGAAPCCLPVACLRARCAHSLPYGSCLCLSTSIRVLSPLSDSKSRSQRLREAERHPAGLRSALVRAPLPPSPFHTPLLLLWSSLSLRGGESRSVQKAAGQPHRICPQPVTLAPRVTKEGSRTVPQEGVLPRLVHTQSVLHPRLLGEEPHRLRRVCVLVVWFVGSDGRGEIERLPAQQEAAVSGGAKPGQGV